MYKIIAIVFLSMPILSFALITPKYLSVNKFESCLALKDYGSWKGWCLPDKKPKSCPATSFSQLQSLDVPHCK